MLCTRVTEDVIATGFILSSSLTILSTIVMLESRENLRKKKGTEVVKDFLLEKHQSNKDIENGNKKHSQSTVSSFDAQAFSALMFCKNLFAYVLSTCDMASLSQSSLLGCFKPKLACPNGKLTERIPTHTIHELNSQVKNASTS